MTMHYNFGEMLAQLEIAGVDMTSRIEYAEEIGNRVTAVTLTYGNISVEGTGLGLQDALGNVYTQLQRFIKLFEYRFAEAEPAAPTPVPQSVDDEIPF